jgi:hypothetical protein
MIAILIGLGVLVALLAWAAVFDHNCRRQGLASRDIASAIRRARGDAEGRGGVTDGGGPGMTGLGA